ncbi:MAG: Metallo-beta-lactamase family protein, RNA-specific [Candidatus Jettenia ecosi]|uniref:Metallo-beta-lactamase family protein, RNA-specific n=1 Tax=Candidatus Jettenia ecosi TaxID=2494326 RepID=A0A533Q7N6_9BACT|nr:MAG: Metallo-beta-lactamase family protein, RNA-specific [Candidatus Jettenia ecosi]
MKIKFIGAARAVTGSCYSIQTKEASILVDCGMFQGTRDNEKRNARPFPFEPSEVQYLLLTHAHLDHSGLIPKLVKDGFRGKVLATSATMDLSNILLLDSAHIQELDAAWENKRRIRAGKSPVRPLYTVQEAADSLTCFQPVAYNEIQDLGNGITVRFRDAGHILGSAVVELWVKDDDDAEEKKLIFSGDLGQKDLPFIKDPTPIEEGDYIFVESTYGNRKHKGIQETMNEFTEAITESVKRGGNVIIPSFAVGRTQDILYILNRLSGEGKLDHLQVFVDSPMALQATRVMLKHPECMDSETLELVKRGYKSKLNLKFTGTVEDSMQINKVKSGAIIISSSGMCEAGRIRHHLKHNLWRPECSVIFVGYQAEGTLGRKIIEGEKRVKIFGEEIAVNARVYTIGGLSAHADRDELIDWLGKFKKKPKRVFVIHGEEETSLGFAETIRKQLNLDAFVPNNLEQIQI